MCKKYIATSFLEYLSESKKSDKIWYHGSDYKFDSFENFKSSGPSALGIFVTDDKGLAELFGENVYNVSISYKNSYKITRDKWDAIRDKHAKDTSYFQKMREDLIDKGYDSILIKEREVVTRTIVFKDGNIVILFDKSQLKIL